MSNCSGKPQPTRSESSGLSHYTFLFPSNQASLERRFHSSDVSDSGSALGQEPADGELENKVGSDDHLLIERKEIIPQ